LEVKEPGGLFSPPANIDRLGCNRPRPKPPNVASEIKWLWSCLRCRHGEHQMCDPEGNLIDISKS